VEHIGPNLGCYKVKEKMRVVHLHSQGTAFALGSCAAAASCGRADSSFFFATPTIMQPNASRYYRVSKCLLC
jgi:hypothetical protein